MTVRARTLLTASVALVVVLVLVAVVYHAVYLGGKQRHVERQFDSLLLPGFEADHVTGLCPPLETVRVWSKDWQLGSYAETSATADASGRYTATFTGHDLRTSDRVHPSFADDEGDEVLLSLNPPTIMANLDQGRVFGAGDARPPRVRPTGPVPVGTGGGQTSRLPRAAGRSGIAGRHSSICSKTRFRRCRARCNRTCNVPGLMLSRRATSAPGNSSR